VRYQHEHGIGPGPAHPNNIVTWPDNVTIGGKAP
jgi:hypothetical protein